MKKLLIPALLLAAASSYGALTPSTGDRNTDYSNWFGKFTVASDKNYTSAPYPAGSPSTPAPYSDAQETWAGWGLNTGSANPTVNTYSTATTLSLEVVFLGETAGWWDDLGYTIYDSSGVAQSDTLIGDSIQTYGGLKNTTLLSYAEISITLQPGWWIDIFVTGSGVSGPNYSSDPTVGSAGGKYYIYGVSNNTPEGSDIQSYTGRLTPKTSVSENGNLAPYTVAAFEDINAYDKQRDSDFNDVIFAFRATLDVPQAPVPEPSTYGLIGAGALLAVVGYRRFKKAKA